MTALSDGRSGYSPTVGSVARPWRLAAATARFGAAAGGAYLAPSLCVLAQWWPRTASDFDPGGVPGLCTWRARRGYGQTIERQVALTFDDGPDPDSTPGVLERLEELGVQATFLCLGQQADAHPGLVKDMAGAGHEVGVHGYRHQRQLFRGPDRIEADLAESVRAVQAASGRPVRWFRPPYGQVSAGSVIASRRLGLDLVLWSSWGREWADRDPVSVARRVTARLGPGAIVLLHDSAAAAPAGTAEIALAALDPIVEAVHRRGLRPVTLSELVPR